MEITDFIEKSWWQGVYAVQGRSAVREAIRQHAARQYDGLLAVGKAAASMTLGALDEITQPERGLVITKYDHLEGELQNIDGFSIIESAHPIPDSNSLKAGQAGVEFVASFSEQSHLLVLVSGGASSLMEQLPDSLNLENLQWLNQAMLSKGWDIQRMNQFRSHLSRIKAGKLWQHFKGQHLDILAISDVQGDSIEVIGSGIGSPNLVELGKIEWPDEKLKVTETDEPAKSGAFQNQHSASVKIVASNQIARQAAANFATESGFAVQHNEESLYADYQECANMIVNRLRQGGSGYYVWGGEPTVNLPDEPGNGGRNQALALSIAMKIKDLEGIHVLCAGTDGTDGPTHAAGAMVNGETVKNLNEAEAALIKADSGRYLDSQNALFVSGPTGTNVMDLVIAIKQD